MRREERKLRRLDPIWDLDRVGTRTLARPCRATLGSLSLAMPHYHGYDRNQGFPNELQHLFREASAGCRVLHVSRSLRDVGFHGSIPLFNSCRHSTPQCCSVRRVLGPGLSPEMTGYNRMLQWSVRGGGMPRFLSHFTKKGCPMFRALCETWDSKVPSLWGFC
jgi:hypothetical protein